MLLAVQDEVDVVGEGRRTQSGRLLALLDRPAERDVPFLLALLVDP